MYHAGLLYSILLYEVTPLKLKKYLRLEETCKSVYIKSLELCPMRSKKTIKHHKLAEITSKNVSPRGADDDSLKKKS